MTNQFRVGPYGGDDESAPQAHLRLISSKIKERTFAVSF